MQAQRNAEATFGPYSLESGVAYSAISRSAMLIRRQDADHKRTVAVVHTTEEWDRFVAALKAGANEVAAVHAIDEDKR